ncbi:hypothetical protein JKP88DRAFT_286810 [Tribonema minus]|uniref:Uncharacterized protein n=1 Tax=Tribonema minus TaxID=303371 RepID=A0A836CKB5_9STRA|nr:hypothetical protein JKP88DRAFT_286810 [Tribonema minus]
MQLQDTLATTGQELSMPIKHREDLDCCATVSGPPPIFAAAGEATSNKGGDGDDILDQQSNTGSTCLPSPSNNSAFPLQDQETPALDLYFLNRCAAPHCDPQAAATAAALAAGEYSCLTDAARLHLSGAAVTAVSDALSHANMLDAPGAQHAAPSLPGQRQPPLQQQQQQQQQRDAVFKRCAAEGRDICAAARMPSPHFKSRHAPAQAPAAAAAPASTAGHKRRSRGSSAAACGSGCYAAGIGMPDFVAARTQLDSLVQRQRLEAAATAASPPGSAAAAAAAPAHAASFRATPVTVLDFVGPADAEMRALAERIRRQRLDSGGDAAYASAYTMFKSALRLPQRRRGACDGSGSEDSAAEDAEAEELPATPTAQWCGGGGCGGSSGGSGSVVSCRRPKAVKMLRITTARSWDSSADGSAATGSVCGGSGGGGMRLEQLLSPRSAFTPRSSSAYSDTSTVRGMSAALSSAPSEARAERHHFATTTAATRDTRGSGSWHALHRITMGWA